MCYIFKEKKIMRPHLFKFGLYTESAWTHVGLLYTDFVCGPKILNRGRIDTTLILLVNRKSNENNNDLQLPRNLYFMHSTMSRTWCNRKTAILQAMLLP